MAEKCGQLVKPIPSPLERENAGEEFVWHDGNN